MISFRPFLSFVLAKNNSVLLYLLFKSWPRFSRVSRRAPALNFKSDESHDRSITRSKSDRI